MSRDTRTRGNNRPARSRGTFDVTVDGRLLTFQTQPGVFSHGALDEGTELLLETVLPELRPHQTILDLGAGVGVLGIAMATKLSRGEVWLADSDVRAVRLVEENMALNAIDNAHVCLSDVTLDVPQRTFDLVVSNPPTHSGKDVLASFVCESYDVLRPGGKLLLVVNRMLSVRDMMADVFGCCEQIARRHGFIVFSARKPRRGEIRDA